MQATPSPVWKPRPDFVSPGTLTTRENTSPHFPTLSLSSFFLFRILLLFSLVTIFLFPFFWVREKCGWRYFSHVVSSPGLFNFATRISNPCFLSFGNYLDLNFYQRNYSMLRNMAWPIILL